MPNHKLLNKYQKVRAQTISICDPLETEDYVVQPIMDVSPPKWHLAHTTWFFETFILKEFSTSYKIFHPQYAYLFNSYYVSAGERLFRPDRGFMTRPTVKEVFQYRTHVDEAMEKILSNDINPELQKLIEIGLNHEQQHQELLLYDIKYILGNNPLFPVYLPIETNPVPVNQNKKMLKVEEGLYHIGHSGKGFHFDNELGQHQVFLTSYQVMNRLVTNEEFVDFIEDGGYEDHRFWFMEAHEWTKEKNIKAPLYWHKMDGIWHRYSLRGGLRPIDPKTPLTHVSMYEADAFAKWSGKRLPTELEWETAANKYGMMENGNFLENKVYEPTPLIGNNNQFFGDVWEWTNSAYLPYPGYEIPKGAIGEYNGKFMINQMILRGGSCATPSDHIRDTYRNFFHPESRWLFSGIRLAEHI